MRAFFAVLTLAFAAPFGTDEAPEALDNMLGRYEAMLNACGVPELSRRKIYGETMARILNIPVRP